MALLLFSLIKTFWWTCYLSNAYLICDKIIVTCDTWARYITMHVSCKNDVDGLF